MDVLQLATEQLEAARADEYGRSAQLVVHDGPLRQTVIALAQGGRLAEHNSPPAASLQVIHGSVAVTSAGMEETYDAGRLVALTHDRHAVEALTDAVVLLTTVTGTGEPSHG